MLLSVVMTKKEKEIENDARCYFILAYLFAYFLVIITLNNTVLPIL